MESFVYVYLDDIFVFSKDLGSHVSHVRAVLSRLLVHKLFVKVEKSEFHTTSTSFLGFVISQGGLSMANDRTRAIEDWPVPLSVKQLQRFLGFANFFRRFICGFSLVAAPLMALLKGAPKTLRWTSEAQHAFDGLKHRFSTAPVLVHPDPGRPFVVEVDASDTGVGAILSQRASDDRRLHPCDSSVTEPGTILPEGCVLAPVRWVLLEDVRGAHCEDPPPPETPADRHYVPQSQRAKVLEWAHSARTSGHPGVRGTSQVLSRLFWWPSLEGDVKEFVAACSVCAAHKTDHQRPQGLLLPLSVPRRPWSHIAMDFVTGLPPSKGHTAVLVVADRFSKQARFIPLVGLPTAKQTATLVVTHLVRYVGVPEDVLSDRGPQFIARFWKGFWQALGVTVRLTSGYHPQSNGQVERLNQDMEKYLRMYVAGRPETWADFLLWAEMAHNNQVCSSSGFSPNHVTLGFQPELFPQPPTSGPVPSANRHVFSLHRLWRQARSSLLQSQALYKRQADRRRRVVLPLRPGDKVWLSTRGFPVPTTCRKLAARYIGPFNVVRRVNPVSFQLSIGQEAVGVPGGLGRIRCGGEVLGSAKGRFGRGADSGVP